MLSEKIKTLRKQAKFSQEQLAEKLSVSRQAVTKWETGAGVPDIENLRSLSSLFQISIDELIGNETTASPEQDFLFDSVTKYDIDCNKNYDITFMGAKQVSLIGCEGEKLEVRLASDQITDLESRFKVKIDDVKQKLDIDIHRLDGISETQSKAALYVIIRFPLRYTRRIELSGNTQSLAVESLDADNVEFSGKTACVRLHSATGHIELNSNEDMQIHCENLSGRLDINQLSATSRLCLPADIPFLAVKRGIANSILYEMDGKPAEDFSVKGDAAEICENVIELNGVKSELIIAAAARVPGKE